MPKCKPMDPSVSQSVLTNALSISTAQKMIHACNTLHIPIYATTQSASRLGPSQSLRTLP